MTKSLTEQWKDGTLPVGTYYILDSDGKAVIDKSVCVGELWDNTDIKEVLALVPSYEEYKELTQKVGRLEFDNDVLEQQLDSELASGDEMIRQIKRLEQQLAEANDTLKMVCIHAETEGFQCRCGWQERCYNCNAHCEARDYLEKWGVK